MNKVKSAAALFALAIPAFVMPVPAQAADIVDTAVAAGSF